MKASIKPLEKYLPPGSLALIEPLLLKYPLKLKITKNRQSKFGDYRRIGSDSHQISVNGGLNPYAFLITLVHELAHLEAFQSYGSGIKPHGKEWQHTFWELSQPFLGKSFFPPEIEKHFITSLQKGYASSMTYKPLFRALKTYDNPLSKRGINLEEIPTGSHFKLNNRRFEKGPLSRTRYKCRHLASGRYYMVHGLAEVEPLEAEQ